jgi:hypothetical protein
MYTTQPTPASSVYASISSSILSQRSVWDATRWSGFTITLTATSTAATASPTTVGFSLVSDLRIYSNVEIEWWAIDYDGLGSPIVLNDSLYYSNNPQTANSQTTFCGQTSTFDENSEGVVIGSSDNGDTYTCTTVTNPSTTTTTDRQTIVPQYNCLTNICT